jgi:aspartate-semialdehyde dehydrogenase
MNSYDVAVVGATGMVGRMILKILEERQFPIANFYAFGTRIEMYQKILKLAAEEALEVPLFFNLANVAADKNLKGVEANTIRVNYFRDFSW